VSENHINPDGRRCIGLPPILRPGRQLDYQGMSASIKTKALITGQVCVSAKFRIHTYIITPTPLTFYMSYTSVHPQRTNFPKNNRNVSTLSVEPIPAASPGPETDTLSCSTIVIIL